MATDCSIRFKHKTPKLVVVDTQKTGGLFGIGICKVSVLAVRECRNCVGQMVFWRLVFS